MTFFLILGGFSTEPKNAFPNQFYCSHALSPGVNIRRTALPQSVWKGAKNCPFCMSEDDSKSKVCILQRSLPCVHAAIPPWWFIYLWVLTTGICSDASDVPLALRWDFTAVLPKIPHPVLRHRTKCSGRDGSCPGSAIPHEPFHHPFPCLPR